MSCKRRSSGYTLIEVLVAMVILALSLSVLLRIFSGGLRNISVSDDYTRAVLIARTQLESAGVSSPLAAGSSSSVAEQEFRWTQTVENYVAFENADAITVPLAAYTVTVEVEWPHADSVRRVSLSGVKLGDAKPGNR